MLHICFNFQARNGKLAIEDMDGGTFTISNGGVFGSLMGTPIINPPQSAILGMHGIFDRPVAINGKVRICTDKLLETLENPGIYFGSLNPGNSLEFCVKP